MKISKKWWVIAFIAADVVILAALAIWFFSGRSVSVYGKSYPADTEEVALSGSEIQSVDELIGVLRPLKNLKRLDLGSFPVFAEDEARLLAAFSGVDLHYDACVSLYGITVKTDAEELDLSGCDLSDLTPLKDALPLLPALKKVEAAESVVSLEERRQLEKDFPAVSFHLPALVDLFGRTVRDDTEQIDLTDLAGKKPAIADLSKAVAQLTHLKRADLTGVVTDPDDQLALAKEFPDVVFCWIVPIAGSDFSSESAELDLSGRKEITPALMEKRLPLFSGLTRLDVSDCPGTDEEWAALREAFPEVKVVWRLHMGDFSLKTDAVSFSVLIMKGDKRAQLHSGDLEVLKYCTDLRALDLGHQLITDITAIGEYLPELRILILADNQVSDLTPIAKLKHLHYLELFVNSRNLTDLSPLAQCRELVDVNVSYLYYVDDFSPLYDLPLLERLWAEHTHMTDQEVKALQERYPEAEIINHGEGSVDNGWRTHPRYFAMIKMFREKDFMSEEFSKYDS